MSLAVEIGALRQRMASYGDTAFMVTVTEIGTPHVVSVALRWAGDRLVTSVGRRTTCRAVDDPGSLA